MAETLAKGKEYAMFLEEPEHCADTLLAVIGSLWQARMKAAELERQLAEAQKDAGRYRWLRDQHTVRWDEKCPDDANDRWFVTAWQGNTVGCLEGELDTEIDAAMEASRAD